MNRNGQMLDQPPLLVVGMLPQGVLDVVFVVVAAFLARDRIENQIDQEDWGKGEQEVAGAGLTKAEDGHWRSSNPSHLPSCNNPPSTSPVYYPPGLGKDFLTLIRAHQHAYCLCLYCYHLVLPGLKVQKERPWHYMR